MITKSVLSLSSKAKLGAKLGLASSLALALAACGGDPDDGGAIVGEPIEAIAAPDGGEWNDVVTVSADDGYILGNPDAPIKLVEYASHTCGACANFAASAKAGIKEYVKTGVVSFEQRNLIRDPIDLTIATLVRCGAKENMQPLSDQAWRALEETFQNVQTNSAQYETSGELPVDQRFIAIGEAAGLIDFFAARGLSADQARACLANSEVVEGIANRSAEQSSELGISATPTFLLNGRLIEERSWTELEPMLQRAGARQE